MNRQYIKLTKENMPGVVSRTNYVAFDLETTGLNPLVDQIVAYSFCFDGTTGYYTTDIDIAKHVLGNKNYAKVFHNAIFDTSFLKVAGISIYGGVHDTMLLAHLIDPDSDSIGLKPLAEKYLGAESIQEAQKIWHWLEDNGYKKEDIGKAPEKFLAPYACEDVLNTFDLFFAFRERLVKTDKILKARGYKKSPVDCYLEEDLKLLPVVRDMQLNGVAIDLNAISSKKQELERRIIQCLAELRAKVPETVKVQKILHEKKIAERLAKSKTGKMKKPPQVPEFNWNSGDHLAILFYTVFGETAKKRTKTGKISTDVESFEELLPKYPWLAVLLEQKELIKLVKTYVDGLVEKQQNGRVHANFHVCGTATGRFSSSGPNLQNLPNHGGIKSLFIPARGSCFIYADYSQLELRLAAHLSQDPTLIEAYRVGRDLHRLTASQIYQIEEGQVTDEQRSHGKTVNFAVIYGAESYRLCQILGYFSGIDLDRARELYQARRAGEQLSEAEEKLLQARQKALKKGEKALNNVMGRYPKLAEYIAQQHDKMTSNFFSITETGRVRRLPALQNPDERKQFSHALKAGFNQPIQGLGASITRRAMIELHKRGFKIVNQIHDAIICEVDDTKQQTAIADIRFIMENCYKLSVPLAVEPKVLYSFEEK